MAKETISYVEVVPLHYLDNRHKPSTAEVSAIATQEPNCVEANISPHGDEVRLRVEREFKVEMIAETKVYVFVNPNGSEDLDDKHIDLDSGDDGDYEDLDPDLLDEELN